ncbi:MAG: CPBP family intramembrane glutamic endopeptidase [Candidatus Limnocylindrales bacterium]
MPPVLEPPGSFHREASRRPLLALKGRASLRLYVLSLVVGLPGIAALLFYLVGIRAGLKLDSGPVPPWLIVESVSVLAAVGLIGWAIAQARQRRADGWRDYAGPSPLLTSGALVAIITAIQVALGHILKDLNVDVNSAPATLVLILLYLVVYVSLVHFLAVRTGALTWHDIVRPAHLAPSSDDWTSSSPGSEPAAEPAPAITSLRSRVTGGRLGDILIPLAMVIPLMIVSSVFEAAMLLVLGLHATDIATEIPPPTSDLDRLLSLVAIAVLVPIGEETFFRGFATNAWGRSLSRNSAILRASLFFAFIHVMNTQAGNDGGLALRAAIFNFGARVPVAIALSWLYTRRRSILASGILHGGFNGLITLVSFL